jgi:hypothetical protein
MPYPRKILHHGTRSVWLPLSFEAQQLLAENKYEKYVHLVGMINTGRHLKEKSRGTPEDYEMREFKMIVLTHIRS